MKTLVRIAVALTALASCAAFAQTDNDADRARRDRNMDEVLAEHHVQLDTMNGEAPQAKPTLRERTHHVAETTREKTHKVAQSTRNFTHRQADKARAFSARHGHPKSDGTVVKTPDSTPS
jgi:hypothetical protein